MNWQEVKSHQITLYTTPWCSDCRRLKKYLTAAGVSYDEIDIDADPEAAKKLQARTGRTAIPYVEIDGQWMIRGWHDEAPGKWDENIFVNEFKQVLEAGNQA